MKHILIVTPSLKHGGTNRSLWNFLNTKSNEKYTVDIMAMEHNGPYREKFGKFNLLPENKILASIFSPSEFFGIRKYVKLFYKLLFKTIFHNSKSKVFSAVARRMNFEKYDVAVAFQEGLATEFVSYIHTNKRVAWVRCDYSSYLRLANKTNEANVYEKFEHIVCVSKYTSGVFSSYYPHLSERVRTIYNIIDTKGIIETSRDEIQDVQFSSDGFTLVSVGRMDAVKRFTAIPGIAASLKANGCAFRWYIIGSGGTEEKLVRKAVIENNVTNEVILLGTRNNPYPYIASADILVCTSSTEACPNVVNEAKILHVPVVAADFASALEYIENGVNGIVVSIDNMAEIIKHLYYHKQDYERLKNGISSFTYDNCVISEELDSLFLN